MTTTLTTTPVANPERAAEPRTLWRHALVVGVVAASATTAIAAVSDAAGVSFETDGEAIPPMAFAQLTIVGTLVGLLIALLCRKAPHPRSTFERITVALTAVSVIPDLMLPFDTASRIMLVVTHVVAAAIVVPVLARRLPASR